MALGRGGPGTGSGGLGMDSGDTGGGGGEFAAFGSEYEGIGLAQTPEGVVEGFAEAVAGLPGDQSEPSWVRRAVSIVAGLFTSFFTGSIAWGKSAYDAGMKIGLTKDDMDSIKNQLENGWNTPQGIAEGLVAQGRFDKGELEEISTSLKSNIGSSAPLDPASDDFWGQFVDEWGAEKDRILADDAFRKGKIGPALGEYGDVLSKLAGEADTRTGTFTPINIGFGDNFRTSFQPRSNFDMANKIAGLAKKRFGTELMGAEALRPGSGQEEYLNKLMNLAKFQEELKNRVQVAGTSKTPPKDQGGYLDVLVDIMGVTSDATDLYKDWFKE